MSWGAKRKLIVLLVVLVALGVVLGLPLFLTFYKAPSCFDGVQNQGEEGIDCGGPCARLCQAGFAPPAELWATSSEVVSGVYNLLAYSANPNISVSAPNVSYDFKLYDAGGVLISERSGTTDVPVGPNFAIFEPSVTTGQRAPYRTFFQFTSEPQWETPPVATDFSANFLDFVVASTSSRLDASVTNSALSSFDSVQIIAILYGTDGNVVAFSKTLVPTIAAGATESISFTWPYPITEKIAKKEFLFDPNPSL